MCSFRCGYTHRKQRRIRCSIWVLCWRQRAPDWSCTSSLRHRCNRGDSNMKNISIMASISFAIILLCVAEGTAQVGGDWPQWRGPNRDGKSKETGLLKQWPADGPPLAWKTKGAGRGYSSFAVANGRLFTMGLRGDSEFVIAFDVTTGKEAWATRHGSAFRNDRGDGPR